MKRIRIYDTPKCFSNLGDCSGLSKEARSRNQGSSQLTVWQWLTCVECKLTSQTTNSKQTKKRRNQDTSDYSKPQEKAGKAHTMRIKTIESSNKNFILNVGMEKEQKQELGWRVSVLPIPAFHCILCTCNNSQWWNAGMGNTDTLHPNSCSCSFSIPTSRIKFLLLVG